ncbi:hypothetical protein BGU48_10820 [Clostridioides difficile]|uniref:Uncharacterized protein n=1 Tax=Clostridioides difficile TaxID=1496 RepID=A0AB74QIM7_CLODI|nr:hypothetical protein [Clostridioides difficile]MDC9201285.1 hypothetical protein [Clostridioides difficile]MDV9794274.1 hypothetical protein [Clostridioides difficile]MDV9989351.1 hypothetical protein [Clostridioides difficile]PBF40844.1 hypothetical protein BGU48_10820 [Clostridioides difficile]SJV93794.1 Uncharacterised protein [Clostridioides difficile]
MTREERILRNAILYLDMSEEKQRIVDCILNAKTIENIVENDILDVNKLNEAIKEIEQIIC